MASGTSWTITSTKRKTTTATPAPRKRQRVNTSAKPSSRRPSQKTLTQAQWMTPQPNQLANDDMIEENPRPYTLPKTKNARSRLMKRDSTLTQMDFFDNRPWDLEDIDDQPLPQPGDSGDAPVSLPQFDGCYSSPRRSRPRKAALEERRPGVLKQNPESQEYKPSRRRKRPLQDAEQEIPSSERRTSRRIASKQVVFTDPAQSFEYFNDALATPSAGPRERPQLEIKESLQTNQDEEEKFHQGSKPALRTSLQHLHTPTTKRVIILSSQSPESLPPSMRKNDRHDLPTPDASRRTPLTERSINAWQISPTKSSPKKALKKHKRSPSQVSSPAKKIVVLKLARRAPQPIQQIEDSQKNLWSIPSSSQHQVDTTILPLMQPPPRTTDELSETEIPATSQGHNMVSSPPMNAMQDSLPSFMDIVGRPPDVMNASHKDKSTFPNDSTQNGATGLDFESISAKSEMPQSNRDQFEPPLPDPEPLPHVSKTLDLLVVEDSEAESLESPVKLRSKTLSPVALSTPISPRREHSSTQERAVSPPPLAGTVYHPDLSDRYQNQPVSEPATPLPLPQLVSQSATPRQSTQQNARHEMDEFQLPQPPTIIHRTSTHISTTLVPLNDVDSGSSSSSFPLTKPITQNSVNPASMPHPSQISTQDATQGFLPMSSFPRSFHDSFYEERNDKITIKDSSSYGVSMSQLPQHVSSTQSQLNIDLGLDEVLNSEDEGDIDLDPPSTASRDDRHQLSDIQIERTPQTKRTIDVLRQEISTPRIHDADDQKGNDSPIPSSQQSISISSSPNPPPLKKKYDPIPGFDNDTQSNFTQNGHVTAAYIHRQREAGILEDWYIPEPFQVPGYTRRK